jgi:hypothetical protein
MLAAPGNVFGVMGVWGFGDGDFEVDGMRSLVVVVGMERVVGKCGFPRFAELRKRERCVCVDRFCWCTFYGFRLSVQFQGVLR